MIQRTFYTVLKVAILPLIFAFSSFGSHLEASANESSSSQYGKQLLREIVNVRSKEYAEKHQQLGLPPLSEIAHIFPHGLPLSLSDIKQAQDDLQKAYFTNSLSPDDIFKGGELLALTENRLHKERDSLILDEETCINFRPSKVVTSFQDSVVNLPEIFHGGIPVSLALETDFSLDAVAIQRINVHSIKFSTPLHPLGSEGRKARLVLLPQSSWDGEGPRCPGVEIHILPPEVKTGAFPTAMRTLVADLSGITNIAEGYGLAKPFSERAIGETTNAAADGIKVYADLPPRAKWFLDALYSQQRIGSVDRSALSQMQETLLQNLESIGRRGVIQPTTRNLVRKAAFFNSNALPFVDTRIYRAQADPFANICPTTPEKLNAMATAAVLADLGTRPDTKPYFTAAQVLAGISARLAVQGITGNSEAADIADRAVNTTGNAYMLMLDFTAGMFPSSFTDIDAKTNPSEMFEDSVNDIWRLDEINLTARSKGYDLAKAAINVGLTVASAAGKSGTPMGGALNKTFGRGTKFVNGKRMDALRNSGVSAGKFLDKKSLYTGGRKATDSAFAGFVGNLEGKFIDGAYKQSGLEEKGGAHQIPPLDCIVDIARGAWATISVLKKTLPSEQIDKKTHRLLGKGILTLQIEPSRLKFFNGIKGQPTKKVSIDVPSLNKTGNNFVTVESGANGGFNFDIINSAGNAKLVWDRPKNLPYFAQVNKGEDVAFVAPVNSGCRVKEFYILGSFVSPTFLERSEASGRVMTLTIRVKPANPNKEECEEEEEEIVLESCDLFQLVDAAPLPEGTPRGSMFPGKFAFNVMHNVLYQPVLDDVLQTTLRSKINGPYKRGDRYSAFGESWTYGDEGPTDVIATNTGFRFGRLNFVASGLPFKQFIAQRVRRLPQFSQQPPFSDVSCYRSELEKFNRINPMVFVTSTNDDHNNFLISMGKELIFVGYLSVGAGPMGSDRDMQHYKIVHYRYVGR